MNENDVIKAIECCIQADTFICDECPLYDKDNGCVDTDFKLLSYALEIIKNKDIELQAMRNAANSYKAEVERLNTNIHSMAITMSNSAKAERADAIKEFAERLKKNFETYTDEEETNAMYVTKLIDITVREMTEEK